jgi:hypothetical protein
MMMSGGVPAAAPTECVDKLICQNLEGAGYDNSETWNETGATVNEDYTTIPLRGAQSLYQLDTGIDPKVYASFTGSSEIWAHFLFQTDDSTPAAGNQNFFRIQNSSGTQVAGFSLVGASGLLTFYGCGSSYSTVDALASATTYHIWFYYKKGTGANALIKLGFGTDTNRPTSGNKYISCTDGTGATDAARIYFDGWAGSANYYIVDQILVDDVSFTTVDP